MELQLVYIIFTVRNMLNQFSQQKSVLMYCDVINLRGFRTYVTFFTTHLNP